MDEFNPCVTCKFYVSGGLLGLLEPTCSNPDCVDKGFTSRSQVTGKVINWPDRPMTCWKARLDRCVGGRLWESRR